MNAKWVVGIIAGIIGLGAIQIIHTTAQAEAEYAVTTKTVRVGQITVPKNTRVSVASQVTHHGQRYARVEMQRLRYQLRHQTSRRYLTVPMQDLKATRRVATDQFSQLKQRRVNYDTTQPVINVTTDGRVEVYRDGSVDNQAPAASAQVTKRWRSGQTTVLTLKSSLAQLTTAHTHQLKLRANGAVANGTYDSYAVGPQRQIYYVWTGLS
ncbi:hypothetical protein [Secundilactobacillus muriivasis]